MEDGRSVCIGSVLGRLPPGCQEGRLIAWLLACLVCRNGMGEGGDSLIVSRHAYLCMYVCMYVSSIDSQKDLKRR